MTLLRTWIVSVTACAMVIAAAEALMPDGAVKRVGKLTGGLILVLGLLQPLVKLDYDDWLDDLPAQTAGAVTQEDLEGAAYAPMKSIIERELSAYLKQENLTQLLLDQTRNLILSGRFHN